MTEEGNTKLRSIVVVRVGEIASFRSASVAMTKYLGMITVSATPPTGG